MTARSKREVELEIEVQRGLMREATIASQNLQLTAELLKLQARDATAALARLEPELAAIVAAEPKDATVTPIVAANAG